MRLWVVWSTLYHLSYHNTNLQYLPLNQAELLNRWLMSFTFCSWCPPRSCIQYRGPYGQSTIEPNRCCTEYIFPRSESRTVCSRRTSIYNHHLFLCHKSPKMTYAQKNKTNKNTQKPPKTTLWKWNHCGKRFLGIFQLQDTCIIHIMK